MSFWPKSSENFLDEFLVGGPELVDTATACGKTYKCRIMGGRSMWQSTDSPDFDASLPNVEACRVDSLAAASKAMGTCKPLPNTPDLCRSSAYPVLRSKDDDSTFVHFSSDVTRTKGMPLVLDATLQCVQEDVRASTHVRTSTIEVGKLHKHEFEKRPPTRRSPSPLTSRPTPSITSPPPDLSSPPSSIKDEPYAPPPPPGPSSPSSSSSTASSLDVPRVASPRQPPPPPRQSSYEAPPPPLPIAKSVDADLTHASPSRLPPPAFQTCTWGSGTRPTHVACNTHSDCPLDDTQIFESWFGIGTVGEGGKTLENFVNGINNELTDVEVTLPAETNNIVYNKVSSALSTLTGKSKSVLTKPNLHKKLLELYNSNNDFKDSIKAAVEKEERFRESRSNKCNMDTNRCTMSLRDRLSTKLYDGKQKVTFTLNKNRVLTFQTEDGEDLPAYASKCGEENSSSPLCTKEDGMYDLVLQKERKSSQTWKGHLDPATVPSSVQGFRFSVLGEEYVVENAIRVPATEDAPRVCAQTLCTKHAAQCPAPHCMRDASSDCVPATTT